MVRIDSAGVDARTRDGRARSGGDGGERPLVERCVGVGVARRGGGEREVGDLVGAPVARRARDEPRARHAGGLERDGVRDGIGLELDGAGRVEWSAAAARRGRAARTAVVARRGSGVAVPVAAPSSGDRFAARDEAEADCAQADPADQRKSRGSGSTGSWRDGLSRREDVVGLVPASGAARLVQRQRAPRGEDGDEVGDHHARERAQALGQGRRRRW